MIKAYIGDIGSGKTLLLVRDAQWFFRNNYQIYSNMPMWGFNSRNEKVASSFLFPDDFMAKVRTAFSQRNPTLFVIDEATLVLSAYDWKKTDKDLLMFISQSRKFNIHIFYTSQRFKDVIVPLRENATYVVECHKYFFKPNYLFVGLVLDRYFFLDKAKSDEKKPYIKKRKLGFPFSIKKYYSHYISHYVVMTKALSDELKGFLSDPNALTPEAILLESKKHIDIQPPM